MADPGESDSNKTPASRRLITYLRGEPPAKPDKRAIVPVGGSQRVLTGLDFYLWLKFDATIAQWAASVVAPSFVALIGTVVFALVFNALFPFSSIVHGLSGLVGDYLVAVIVFAGVAAMLLFCVWQVIGRGFRKFLNNNITRAHSGKTNDHPLELTANEAADLHGLATEKLRGRLGGVKAGRIESLTTDNETPYRIVRELAPVSEGFFRTPHEFMQHDLSERLQAQYIKGVRVADWVSSGLLGLVGAHPHLRYGEDSGKALAENRYWRNDIQELPDSYQHDIYLRFHQSAVEANFPPRNTAGDICTYKAYACFGNFRRTPLYLLRVSDVVDCLLGRGEGFTESEHKQIYEGMTIASYRPEEVVRMLCQDVYAKQGPRAERYKFDWTDQPTGKAILSKDEARGDYIMAFDPARVWPRGDVAGFAYREAVIALRHAVHLASRRRLIEITLNRRDILLVDNLRALIARREDGPTGLDTPFALVRDVIAAQIPALQSRWLRLLYGYSFDEGRHRAAGGARRYVEAQNTESYNNEIFPE